MGENIIEPENTVLRVLKDVATNAKKEFNTTPINTATKVCVLLAFMVGVSNYAASLGAHFWASILYVSILVMPMYEFHKAYRKQYLTGCTVWLGFLLFAATMTLIQIRMDIVRQDAIDNLSKTNPTLVKPAATFFWGYYISLAVNAGMLVYGMIKASKIPVRKSAVAEFSEVVCESFKEERELDKALAKAIENQGTIIQRLVGCFKNCPLAKNQDEKTDSEQGEST